MDLSSCSLEAGKETLYRLEDGHATALSEPFDKLLYVLADMDVFGRPTSPSIFIVYAHDNDDGESSGAQCAQCLIKWLLALRSRILSDKSPLRWKREGGIAAARNILSNQFCLLPPRTSTDGSGDEIINVDKVILCGSEVIQQYYRHTFTASYIDGIEARYNKAQHRAMSPEGVRDEIREFVEKHCRQDGFHHVLTELSFLNLRRNSCRKDTDGIIPIVLSGDGMSYLPFLANCDLFLKIDPSRSLTRQHKLFFNLLRQLYADSDSHAIIKAFEDCYKNASEHLQGKAKITRESFRDIAYTEIFKAQSTVLDSRTADIRSEEWGQQWKSQTKTDFSRRDRTLDWLPKVQDVADTHRDNLHQRQGQTGSWILADERYEKWKAWEPTGSSDAAKQINASRLWCHGKPGAGKTIISSIIIEDLQHHTFQPSIALAYVFCKHREEQTASSLILSLVAQLAHQRHRLSEELIRFAERYQNRKTPVTHKLFECMEVLGAEIDQFKKVFVVVDALDERLNDDHGYHLLGSLLKTNANVLVTSRKVGPICDLLSGAESIEIAARPDDVTAYLNFRFQQTETHRLQKLVKRTPTLQNLIVERLVSKTDGMFLLARMHMDLAINSVNRYPTELTARRAVEELSSDLHEVYDEYMDRILKSESAEHATDVLAWVLFAREPVPMRVIQEAIALRCPPKRIDNLIDGHDILGYCIGLVTEKGPPTDMVTFVHPDMERYFRDLSTSEKIRNWIPNGPQRIVRSCLECLLLDDTEAQSESPLWSYGAKHWGHHVQDKYAELQHLISKYLSQPEKVSSAMQYSMQMSPPSPPMPTGFLGLGPDDDLPNGLFHYTYGYSVPSKCCGWHVASYFGISQHFDSARKKDIDCRDSNGWTPLWWAILGRQDAMVKLLLKHGAEVNTKSNENEPLAIWMLGAKHNMEPTYSFQNKKIVDQIAGFPAIRTYIMPMELSYINFMPRASGFATQQVSLTIIKALSGDGLNARDHNGDTVLMTAARRWQCSIVRQLIDQGADISLRNNAGETAFLQALDPQKEHWYLRGVEISGKESVVVFGPDISLSPETTLDPYSFGTLEAITGEMLMTLIPNDIIGSSEEGQKALRLAIANRHSTVVSELLERGANPNGKYEDGYTPLALACMPPDLLAFTALRISIRDMAKLFGVVHVYTKAPTHAVKSPAAYESWHAEASLCHDVTEVGNPLPTEFDSTVRTLLNKGADIDREINGKTALALAAENEYLSIFRTLLDAGANILKVPYNLLLRLAEVITQFEFSKGAYDQACFRTLQDFQTHDYCVLLLGFTFPKARFLVDGIECIKGEAYFADTIEIELPLQLGAGGKPKRSANIQEKWTPRGEYERRVRENGGYEPEELLDMICSKIEEATQRARMAGSGRLVRCSWRWEDIEQSWSRRRHAVGSMGSTYKFLSSRGGLTSFDCNGHKTISDTDDSNSEPPMDTTWQQNHDEFLQRWTQATHGLLDALERAG